jgi:hypothetical protein
MESSWVHSALRPPIRLSCQPLVIILMEKLVEWWLVGETEVLGENLHQCRFVHQKPHMLCPYANPDRRGGKPATNPLELRHSLRQGLRLDRDISASPTHFYCKVQRDNFICRYINYPQFHSTLFLSFFFLVYSPCYFCPCEHGFVKIYFICMCFVKF